MYKEKLNRIITRLKRKSLNKSVSLVAWKSKPWWSDKYTETVKKFRKPTSSSSESQHQSISKCELYGYHLDSVLRYGLSKCKICSQERDFDEVWYGDAAGFIRECRETNRIKAPVFVRIVNIGYEEREQAVTE